MILEELIVYSRRDEKVLKKYKFNTIGLNIILGEKRTTDDETNGVGKTTMVECIEMLLGKSISKQYENNEILIEKDIMIVLKTIVNADTIFLARLFNSPKKGYSIRSEISYDISKWHIHSTKEYRQLIHELVFINEVLDFTSFSSLREYIIRDEKRGFNDIILTGREATKTYSYLSYLFGLPYNSETEINVIKKEMDKLKQQIKYIESGTNINSLILNENTLENEITTMKNSIKSFDITGHYEANSLKYSELKTELNKIQNKIFESEHIKQQFEKNIENLEAKTKDIKRLKDIAPFYNQLVGYFPDSIHKNYKEIESFYNFMVDNRGKYFSNKIDNLVLKIKDLNQKKHEIEIALKKSAELLRNDNLVDDITTMINEVERKQLELAEIRVKISEYNQRNRINDNINLLESEKLRITSIRNDEFLSYEEHIEYLQNIFTTLMSVTYNQSGVLIFEYENSGRGNAATGRIKINCSIPDEKSHGRQYMKINMFDLTWFLYRTERQKAINFLLHDGSYSKPDIVVKPRLLRYINKVLKTNQKGQYFVTINVDELLEEDVDEFMKENLVIAELDRSADENRFFGFKY
ncbi:DUF2326 domain-containing protein [Paenibacillus sp. Marseille-P2973]|uniref:DUF2326 domain-containing protein n=1 Tax=Paenibacillus sp. Marseille-P2973 TaxID=1871032 RepID=UPI001B39BD41|nr:DUF2326 domain-containing protein [Paenibacillus sp. Marseille-P2973]MBQ4901250.1 DUF2326 domain-containing protein [Paenibacillus sp. Marseille-P2973]